MVNFTTSTLSKEGTVVAGVFTYSILLTVENNELTRLSCAISKKIEQPYPDGNGGYTSNIEDIHIGNITLEYGRRVIEISQDENLVPHLEKFQEILDEVFAGQSSRS